MDATFYWSANPKKPVDKTTGDPVAATFRGTEQAWNETLVETINDTASELQKFAFSKWGRAKRLSVKVDAPESVIRILRGSVLWSPPQPVPELSENASKMERYLAQPSASWTPVADFGVFKLNSNVTLPDDTIRIIAEFDVDDGTDKMMYGNVKVIA